MAPHTREMPAHALLAAQPIFQGVDRDAIARLASAASRRALARGEALFLTGDRPTGMYVVIFGSVRLVSHGVRGARLTGVARAGQSLGEPVMFLNRPAIVDAVAAEDSLVLHLPRDAVLDEIRRDPSFAIHMLGTLSQRIQALVHELERHASGSARERLIQYLVRYTCGPAPHTFVLPATKASIASQLLVTPEHLSRLLRAMTTEGLLEVAGRQVTIPDLARLRAELRDSPAHAFSAGGSP